jgi:hypothetical protein
MTDQKRDLTHYELFKNLTKDGARWEGDTFSKKWSECLVVPDDYVEEKVKVTLSVYKEGEDYKIERNRESGSIGAIWF